MSDGALLFLLVLGYGAVCIGLGWRLRGRFERGRRGGDVFEARRS